MLFCNLVCAYVYGYVRSNLVIVVFFIVKSESKRSHWTDFVTEDTNWNFERHSCGILCVIFQISTFPTMSTMDMFYGKISGKDRFYYKISTCVYTMIKQ